jgi:hypothetical protein
VTLLSDEVWGQLDPDAGRLPRRTVLRLRWSLAGAVALAVLAGLVWQSGLTVPRLSWTPNGAYGFSASTVDRTIEFEVRIANRGWSTVEVLGLGRSGPGFELRSVRAQLPTTLRPGEDMDAVLSYQVTDCAAVPAGVWPVPVTVRRTWGTATGHVQPPTQVSQNAPTGQREYQGRDPFAVEWQRAVADMVCYPR